MSDPAEMPVDSGEEIIEYNDIVRLPVGLDTGDGIRYREVAIEELTGIDDHLIAGKKANGNGAIGLSLVLCRCIQGIEGLVETKTNPESMIERNLVKKMTQADRDFLITKIRMLGGTFTGIMAGTCPRCEKSYDEEIDLRKLEVVEWPEDKPLQIEFELEIGHIERDPDSRKPIKAHKKGLLTFPTGFQQEAVGKMQDPVTIMDAMLSACITRLGSIDHIDQEMTKRLKSRDRRYLMQVLKTQLPGLRQWKSVECDCGREFDITLDVAAFFEGRRR